MALAETKRNPCLVVGTKEEKLLEKRPQIRTIRCGTPPIERGRKGIHEKEGRGNHVISYILATGEARPTAETHADRRRRAWGMAVGARNCPTWRVMGHKLSFSSLAKEWRGKF